MAKSAGSMPAPRSAEEALGQLIFMANPYATSGDMQLPTSLNQVPVEEDNYAAQWTFKGQTQNVKRALRIQYKYNKRNDAGQIYTVTEHLLVGFAGTNGPG